MAETVGDKKDDTIITMPKGYADSVLEHPHFSVGAESVATCRVDVLEPQKKIGSKIVCDRCGKVFDLVEDAD
jgi:hypothetical protein